MTSQLHLKLNKMIIYLGLKFIIPAQLLLRDQFIKMFGVILTLETGNGLPNLELKF